MPSETALRLEEACRAARRLRMDVVRQVKTQLAGAYASAFHGSGSEFRDFRPYVAGDDLRRMDWLVTARRQAPYVRRYVEERELRVVLAVDVSRSMRASRPGGTPWHAALQAAAALALAAAWNHDRIGAFGFSEGVDLCRTPRSGERHALSIVRDLLACRPSGSRTTPVPILARLARIRSHALVFLISDVDFSPALTDPETRAPLAACVGRHRLAVVRTAPVPAGVPDAAVVRAVDVESDRTALLDAASGAGRMWGESPKRSRTADLSVLRELGCRLVELPPGPDPAGRLAAGLRRLP